MYCVKCGTKMNNNDRFCPSCGNESGTMNVTVSAPTNSKLVEAKCTNCNAILTVIPTQDAAICPYCNSAFIVEKAISNYTLNVGSAALAAENAIINVNGIANTDNYLEIARNACESKNYEEAEKYANKIIEMNPNISEAWEIKGISAGWQSTLGNLRFNESIKCWAKAVELSYENEKKNVKNRVGEEMQKMVISYFSTQGTVFGSNPSTDSCNDLTNYAVFNYLHSFDAEIGSNIVNYDSVFNSISLKMIVAAMNGRMVANNSYGPERSDKNKYAYATWTERMQCCITVLECAARYARDEKILQDAISDAISYQKEVINSKCYKMRVTELGVDYVTDYSCLNSDYRKHKIEEYRSNYNKYLEAINENNRLKEIKRKSEVEDFWKNHIEEKCVLEKTKNDIEKIKEEDYSLFSIIRGEDIIKEILSILDSCDETRKDSFISEINQGIIESRKKNTLQDLKKTISEQLSVNELKHDENLLVLFGNYEDANKVLEKCRSALAIAEKREKENTLKKISELELKMRLAKTDAEVNDIYSKLMACGEYVDKKELDEKAAKQKELILLNKKKRKKRIKIIIAAALSSVVLMILLIIQSRFWIGKALYVNGNYISAVKVLDGVPGLASKNNNILSRAYLDAGKTLLSKENYSDAKQCFERSQVKDAEKYYLYAEMLRLLDKKSKGEIIPLTEAYQISNQLGDFENNLWIRENNKRLKELDELEGTKWVCKRDTDKKIVFKDGALVYDGRTMEIYYDYCLYTDAVFNGEIYISEDKMSWYYEEWRRVGN